MEAELKCAHCREFYRQPVLLPCFHSLCYACSLHLQEKFTTNVTSSSSSLTSASSTLKSKASNQNQNNPFANAAKSITAILSSSLSPSSSSSSSSSSSTCDDDSNSQANFSSHSILSDLDKLSMASDSGDSGVITTNNSRPCSSYIQQSSSLPPPPPLLPTSSLYSTYLQCPKCARMIYMDDTGVDSLTPNTCLENIVERHVEKLNNNNSSNTKSIIKCQMCPIGPSGNEASVMCEQCNIYYCDACRDAYHPMRGPLLKHMLVKPLITNQQLAMTNSKKHFNQNKCMEHQNESISFYCLVCKCVCCSLCVNDTTTHLNHQVQQINVFCKSQKVITITITLTLKKSREYT